MATARVTAVDTGAPCAKLAAPVTPSPGLTLQYYYAAVGGSLGGIILLILIVMLGAGKRL